MTRNDTTVDESGTAAEDGFQGEDDVFSFSVLRKIERHHRTETRIAQTAVQLDADLHARDSSSG